MFRRRKEQFMSKECCNETKNKEKALEKEALKAYNESMSNKVMPQNMEHNARAEGFARKEQQWNQ